MPGTNTSKKNPTEFKKEGKEKKHTNEILVDWQRGARTGPNLGLEQEMVKSRFAKGAAQILLLRDLCELETRLGFSHLTTGFAQTHLWSQKQWSSALCELGHDGKRMLERHFVFWTCLRSFEAPLHLGHSF